MLLIGPGKPCCENRRLKLQTDINSGETYVCEICVDRYS